MVNFLLRFGVKQFVEGVQVGVEKKKNIHP